MLSTSTVPAISLLCHGRQDDPVVSDARPDLIISKPEGIHVHNQTQEEKLTARTAGPKWSSCHPVWLSHPAILMTVLTVNGRDS